MRGFVQMGCLHKGQRLALEVASQVSRQSAPKMCVRDAIWTAGSGVCFVAKVDSWMEVDRGLASWTAARARLKC